MAAEMIRLAARIEAGQDEVGCKTHQIGTCSGGKEALRPDDPPETLMKIGVGQPAWAGIDLPGVFQAVLEDGEVFAAMAPICCQMDG